MKKMLRSMLIILSLMFLSGCQILNDPLVPNLNPNSSSESTSDGTVKEEGSIPKDKNEDSTEDKTEGEKETDNEENTSPYSIKDYYPFKENVIYSYEGKGNEYAEFTTWVDYIKEDRIQIRTNNGGTEVCKVIENKDGELKVLLSREECYYREDFTGRAEGDGEILLKEPLAKGTSWTLPDGRKRYISNTEVKVTTPSGSYEALEVTTEDKESTVMDYYALNIGLVKTLFKSEGMEVSSSLSKVQKDSPLIQTVKFYYPNINDEKLYYTSKNLSFKTNDITKIAFEKEFKQSPSKELGKLLGPNVKIMSMYLNKDNAVYVDFTKELVTEMNAGSGYEEMILQCITNTIGEYYGVNKVYITVETKPYTSGHIAMEKWEAFTVKTEGAVKLK
jgi:spore germination protein GerM